MSTKTSPRRRTRKQLARIVRCDEALAIALGLAVKPTTKADR